MSDDTDGTPRKKMRRAMEDGPELKSKPVLIRVGSTKEEYHIHENILRSNSSFFDNALKKEWIKDQDQAVYLREANNEAFNIWVKWLYTGNIFLIQPGDRSSDGGKCKEVSRSSACYALGDFLQDTAFKDACIDAVIEYMTDVCRHSVCLAHSIYEHSTKESNHRRLAIDVFVNLWNRQHWAINTSQPQQFFHDVVKAIGPKLASGIQEQSHGKFFNSADTCKYHDHGADKPCYKTKPAFRF